MTLEMCEIQLLETLTALDSLGAGASRSACYVAMALDSIGEAHADIAATGGSLRVATESGQVTVR